MPMQSRIPLVGGPLHSVVTLSNAGIRSENIVAEQHRYPAGEMQDGYYRHHVLAVSSGPTVTLEGCVEGRAQTRQVVPGDICFFPQGLVFRKRWDREFELFHVALEPAFVAEVALETIGSTVIILDKFRRPPEPQIKHLALALKTELERGAPAGSIYQESVGLALCVHLLRQFGRTDSPSRRTNFGPGGLAQPALRRTIEYIRTHLESELSLASMARVACLSPYHFSRAFKSSTGLSPHQYVLRARVEAAKRLLVARDMSLSEIAFRVGFFDQSHLSRHFKRHYGATPNAFLSHS